MSNSRMIQIPPGMINAMPVSYSQTVSGGNIVFSADRISTIGIDGKAVAWPVGGAALAPTGFTVGATYNLFAFDSGGVAALEARLESAGHVASGIGYRHPSGDTSRRLVGKARCLAGPSWSAALLIRFDNREKRRVGMGNGTLGQATAGPWAAITNMPVLSFLTWGEVIDSIQTGKCYTDAAGGNGYLRAAYGQTSGTYTTAVPGKFMTGTAEKDVDVTQSIALSEGWWEGTLQGGRDSGATTASYAGGYVGLLVHFMG